MKFRLEKCTGVSLKCDKLHRKQRIRDKMENEIKELESRKACKCLGV
jgi:hypothetical protein